MFYTKSEVRIMNEFILPQFTNIIAATTTRLGGVSLPPFDANNLALHVGDDVTKVQQNRLTTLQSLNIAPLSTVFTYQYHSDTIVKVEKQDKGRGFSSFEEGIRADALYTKEKDVALAIYHADCVPVFIYVPTKHLVAIIHAGEEGSINHITQKSLLHIMKEENILPHEIYAAMGPSLSFSHRIISEEKAFALMQKDEIIQKSIKATLPNYFLDLPLLNFLDLRSLGIPVVNITLSNECTFEQNEKYYSGAKEKVTGRNISIIKLI